MMAWCAEGRHEGTKPRWSRPCPGVVGSLQCDCDCHTKGSARFKRKKRAQSKDDDSTAD